MERRIGIFILLLSSILFSCREQGREGENPQSIVYLTLHLDGEARILEEPLSAYEILRSRLATDWVGRGGVVVVSGLLARGQEVYYAYDLACPYEAYSPTILRREETDKALVAYRCPVCKTLYELSLGTGHPLEGPGKKPLEYYHVVREGRLLRVQNVGYGPLVSPF